MAVILSFLKKFVHNCEKPKKFKGRACEHATSLFLHGKPGTGKTSTMLHCQNSICTWANETNSPAIKPIFCYVNAVHLHQTNESSAKAQEGTASQPNFKKKIVAAISKGLGINENSSTTTVEKHLLEQADNGRRPAVILVLDEMDVLTGRIKKITSMAGYAIPDKHAG
mmetsp:Transcript_47782/g.55868  ORF Transcript_47782/g.55868 Transcript_47782/m.55868 type:complete len:168 (+) Transcript_47782:171-674(+)